MRASAIGLCLSEEPLYADARTIMYASSECLRKDEDEGASVICVVPTYPFVANVQCDASAATLSMAFNVPEKIAAEWCGLTHASSNTNMSGRDIQKRKPSGELLRFTPRSVVNEYFPMSSLSRSSSSPPKAQERVNNFSAQRILDIAQAQKACETLSLDSQRFASLFIHPDDPAADILRFALDLSQRLRTVAKINNALRPSRRCLPHIVEKSYPQWRDYDDDDEFAFRKYYRLDKISKIETRFAYCGLQVRRTHRHIEIICEGAAAHKLKGDLYRTTNSVGIAAYPPDSTAGFSPSFVGSAYRSRTTYFEVAIIDEGDIAGGICVGIANDQLPANRLVGSDEHSIGLHSDGFIVRACGRFDPCKEPSAFGAGDRVGCAVSADSSGDVVITYFLNGKLCSRSTLQAFSSSNAHSPNDHHLFAAISLFSNGSKVALLCCSRDWLIDPPVLLQEFRFVHSICESPNLDGSRYQMGVC